MSTIILPRTHENVETVYRGRIGCMCGCIGKYSHTARTAANALRDLRAAEADGVEIITGFDIDNRRFFSADRNNRTVCIYLRTGAE